MFAWVLGNNDAKAYLHHPAEARLSGPVARSVISLYRRPDAGLRPASGGVLVSAEKCLLLNHVNQSELRDLADGDESASPPRPLETIAGFLMIQKSHENYPFHGKNWVASLWDDAGAGELQEITFQRKYQVPLSAKHVSSKDTAKKEQRTADTL